MTGWQKGVAASVTSAAIIGFGALAWNWIASANENHAKQAEVEDLARSNYAVVEKLSQRALAEDAAIEQDKKRCLSGIIKDKAICGNVGVLIPDEE